MGMILQAMQEIFEMLEKLLSGGLYDVGDGHWSDDGRI
jgi:hypothetical protein